MNPAGSPPGHWADGAAGRVIRPYALVGGRTKPAGEYFDLIAMVTVRRVPASLPDLEPGHQDVLAMCEVPRSVADLAADLRLPLGVVRVILADLREYGLINIRPPASPTGLLDANALRRIEDGLRRL
jgi:Protein of unknown function (DUF742)